MEKEGVGRQGVRRVGRGGGGSHSEVVENVAGGVSERELSGGEGHADVAGELRRGLIKRLRLLSN